MSALPPTADMLTRVNQCPLSATSGHSYKPQVSLVPASAGEANWGILVLDPSKARERDAYDGRELVCRR